MKDKIAPNVTAAAKALGITRQTLGNWRKDGCPGFNANGSVDLEAVEEWKALVGRDAGKVPAELTATRVRLLTAQAERTERENKLKAGAAIDVTEVRAEAAAIMGTMFTELERIFENDLPAIAKGLDEMGIRTAAKKAIDALRDSLREKIQAMTPEPKTEVKP